MSRGELYRVRHPSSRDPKRARVFVVVSRQALMESRFSTVICAPVYSRYDGLATQVPIGHEEGLKHESSVHLLVPKLGLGNPVGKLQLPGTHPHIGTWKPNWMDYIHHNPVKWGYVHQSEHWRYSSARYMIEVMQTW